MSPPTRLRSATPAPEPIRVMLLDDHPVVIAGLKTYLGLDPELHVIAAVGTAADALKTLEHTQPDVLVMDMHLPDQDGPQLADAIRRQWPSIRVLALSSFADRTLVQRALDAGVAGYLLKDVAPEALADSVKRVARGLRTVDASLEPWARDRRHAGLSAREIDVLAGLGRGLSNKEIAEALFITEKTVKSHVSHILMKLGAKDRTQAVLEGLRRHLIQMP